MNQDNPAYNTWKNIQYVLGGIMEFDRPLLLILAVDILAGGLAPFPLIMLPKFLIDELTGSGNIYQVVSIICLFCFFWLLFTLIKIQTSTRVSHRYIAIRFNFMLRYGRKAMSMDFESFNLYLPPPVKQQVLRFYRCL